MAVVIFDLDDTLYKERDFVVSGFRAVARHVAARTGEDANRLFNIMSSAGNAFDALLEDIAGKPGSEDITIPVLLEIYRFHEPDITLPGESRTLLEGLQASGASLALITDGRSVTQRNKIRALGLDRYFLDNHIFISDETGGDKNTAIPWDAAETLFPGERKIYAGDNMSKDFLQPNLRGWLSVMLVDSAGVNIFPQHPEAHAPQFRPQLSVCSLTSLLKHPIISCQQH